MVWHTQILSADEAGKVAFYENAVASSFLQNRNANQFFICGHKGVGKTLLLRHKSATIRRTLQGVQFVPDTELTEALNSNLASLSEGAVNRLSLWTVWQTIWRATLTVVVARRANVPVSPDIAAIFPGLEKSLSILAHLNAIVSGDLLQLVDKSLPRLSSELAALLSAVQNGVHVFVDAIDELVLLHSGISLRDHDEAREKQFGKLSADVWTSAQIGFAKAALEINRNHRHIRIYGAFRFEALESYKMPDRQNLLEHILHIQYSREDLKQIFLKKLHALEIENPSVFSRREGANIMQRFLGFDRIDHPTVKNVDRSPYSESVLDYLLRHTRGRPRELDDLGKGLQTIAVRERSQSTVRERVRNRSREFYDWAKSEAIPYWRKENDDVLRGLISNWLSRTERDAALRRVRRHSTKYDPFADLFLNGLLGCTVKQIGSDLEELRFRQFDPDAPVTEAEYREAQHFALHPCVNLATYLEKPRYQADPWNVSGHCQKFIFARRKGHVHFGAGALGLGCVVPLLTADTGLGVSILQRTGNEKWNTLNWPTGSQIFLRARILNPSNDEAHKTREIKLTLVRSDIQPDVLRGYLDDWGKGERNLFVLADFASDDALVGEFLSRTDTISTSVKGGNLEKLVPLLLGRAQSGVRIYPFENDEDAIGRFRAAVSEREFYVVDVCVDRICLAPEIKARQKAIEVSVEAFQRATILNNTDQSRKLFRPKASRNSKFVEIVESKIEFEFLRERKRILVNGVHFFFALASRDYLERLSNRDPLVVSSMSDAMASQLLVRTPEIQDILDLTKRLFRIGLLVEAERLGLIKTKSDYKALEQEIEVQQASVQDRLRSMPDKLSRILTPTDENILIKARKFLTLVRNLPQYLRSSRVVSSELTTAEQEKLAQDVQLLSSLFLNQILDAR